MTANTASKFDAMGKEELRAVMREAGISYSKLNNDGMRAALVAHYAKAEEVAAEVEAEEEVRPTSNGMSFAQILGLSPVAAPVHSGPVTRVVDGKKVEAKAPKVKGEPRTRSDNPAAPVVPRVSRKGYTIQKEREERNGVKRPSEGTVCGNVWAEFDKNPEIKAGELQALSDEKGWNRTNVSCEFYAWRKFMGIKGRAAK
jgi:hypothetical protein